MSFFHKKSAKKDLRNNLFIYFVFLVLFFIFLFSLFNLISIIKIKKQINIILSESSFNVSGNDSSSFVGSSKKVVVATPKQVYYNANADGFSGNALINLEKTNLFFDGNVTALTFKPVYEIKKGESCGENFCGLQTFNKLSCLKSACVYKKDEQLYFNNSLVELPVYLKDKNIISTNFNALDTKWIISFIIREEDQEAAYVYLFDGASWQGIITNETTQKIRTKYGFLGGTITASGSDNQFMILYSGYEGFAYLYNKGKIQDISNYFGLRVTNRGFKAKIIKAGNDNLANWYVCSDDGNSRFIKLWQNGSEEIQGAIDLSEILKEGPIFCALKDDRTITIAGKNLYTFIDMGFDNSADYYYQSNNLNSYKDKNILSVSLNDYNINAKKESYKFFVSLDANNWNEYIQKDLTFENNQTIDTFYLKAIFKTFDSEYSPWFGGLGVVSYRTADRN